MMCFAISANKANRLFWLGRYTERVYTSLHLQRRCYDKMIDGDSSMYNTYYNTMNINNKYDSTDDFKLGLMYDKSNEASLISCLEYANDNAIVLREELMSETLSYIQMSIVNMKKAAEKNDMNITNLQPVTDYLLAFWGSLDERIFDERVRNFLEVGRLIEYIDMHIRFNYSYSRISEAFTKLSNCVKIEEGIFNIQAMKDFETEFTVEKYNTENTEYKAALLHNLNQMVLL